MPRPSNDLRDDATDLDEEGPADAAGDAESGGGEADEVRPQIVGCPRCETRVPYGSRYCPTCGVPLVRSGGDAAGALARTRRRTSWSARILAPLVVVAVVAAVLGVAGLLPGTEDVGTRSQLESQLSKVVEADKALTAELAQIRGSSRPSDAAKVADSSLATIREAIARTRAIEPGDDAADVQRVLAAMVATRVYVSTVQQVLRDPGGAGLKVLGARSKAAVAALATTDDVVASQDATGGAARVADNARARLTRSRGSSGSSSGSSATGSGTTTSTSGATTTSGAPATTG